MLSSVTKSKVSQAVVYYIFLSLIIVSLVLRALELRLPGMSKDFWYDETHHNFSAIDPPHLLAMLESINAHYRPFLDFFLRKHFWIALFGYHEIVFRLPGLIYSLITVVLCFLGPLCYLRTKNLPGFYLLSASLVTALFALNNAVDIFNVSFARDYNLVPLASVLWVLCFVFYEERIKGYTFAIVSFLVMNVHFFLIPLVASGYGYMIIRAWVGRSYKKAFLAAIAIVVMVVMTVGINHQAFFELLLRPHSTSGLGHSGYSVPVWQVLQGTLRKYSDFMRKYLLLSFYTPSQEVTKYYQSPQTIKSISLGLLFPLVLLLMNLLFIKRRENQKITLLAFFVLPVLFAYISRRTDHSLQPNYYTPFFGVGLGLLTLFLYNLYNIIERLRCFVNENRKWIVKVVAGFSIGIFLFLFQAHTLPGDLLKDRTKLQIPPKNFSEYYRIYQEIKQSQVPYLLLI